MRSEGGPRGLIPVAPQSRTQRRRQFAVATLLLAGVGLWAHWPAVQWIVDLWRTEPDYAHGFLLLPVGAGLLWLRRERVPRAPHGSVGAGLALIGLSVIMKTAGIAFFVKPLLGWSLVVWLTGACCLLGGRRLLAWCWPALGLSLLCIPLPYRAEHALSLPMQQCAAMVSSALLQCLGEPAVREGNVILLRDLRLEVAQACSGVRLLMGFVALGYVYAVVTGGPLWRRGFLVAAAVPIAVLANAARIAATGWLASRSSNAEWTLHHDAAGWASLVAAALMSGMLLWLLNRIVVPVDVVRPIDVVRR
ncbi:MAG: exosortase/archaeosortase family protein [Planctomycetes bacterium]|nr:exosortase/archaeosortase family protein [Planctomycetota bacterium]